MATQPTKRFLFPEEAQDAIDTKLDEWLRQAQPGALMTPEILTDLCGGLLAAAYTTAQDVLFSLVMDDQLEPTDADWWNNEEVRLKECRVPARQMN